MLTRIISVDGSGVLLFFRLLSQLYQGLEPIDPPPYYEPRAIKFTESPKAPLPIFRQYDPSAPLPWEQPERKAMDFVAFRLTATQLAEIHNTITKGMEQLRMSRVDTVAGLLARCLSEVEPESKPIDTIVNVVNVRALVSLSCGLTYFVIAPRNGHISDQRSGQRDCLAPCRSTGLERHWSSRRRFGLRDRNTQVAGEVEGSQTHQRHGHRCRQITVADGMDQKGPGSTCREGRLLDRQ